MKTFMMWLSLFAVLFVNIIGCSSIEPTSPNSPSIWVAPPCTSQTCQEEVAKKSEQPNRNRISAPSISFELHKNHCMTESPYVLTHSGSADEYKIRINNSEVLYSYFIDAPDEVVFTAECENAQLFININIRAKENTEITFSHNHEVFVNGWDTWNIESTRDGNFEKWSEILKKQELKDGSWSITGYIPPNKKFSMKIKKTPQK